jgi:hypothetical protein
MQAQMVTEIITASWKNAYNRVNKVLEFLLKGFLVVQSN